MIEDESHVRSRARGLEASHAARRGEGEFGLHPWWLYCPVNEFVGYLEELEEQRWMDKWNRVTTGLPDTD